MRDEADGETSASEGASRADVEFLLSMTYEEAKKITTQHLEMQGFCKVAANEITILKADTEGHPMRVRATGSVYVAVESSQDYHVLGQEAYIERGGEIIVRGKPLLKRGRSLVEGVRDRTVFYIAGSRLQVVGDHRVPKPTKDPQPQSTMVAASYSGGGQGGGFAQAGNVPSNWRRSWQDGPNPLLPALSPSDVPDDLRASPLLPPPWEDDLPVVPGSENMTGRPSAVSQQRQLGRRTEQSGGRRRSAELGVRKEE